MIIHANVQGLNGLSRVIGFVPAGVTAGQGGAVGPDPACPIVIMVCPVVTVCADTLQELSVLSGGPGEECGRHLLSAELETLVPGHPGVVEQVLVLADCPPFAGNQAWKVTTQSEVKMGEITCGGDSGKSTHQGWRIRSFEGTRAHAEHTTASPHHQKHPWNLIFQS